jgi:hypothetical protein
MLKKRVLIFSLFCLLAVSSCLQPISNLEREPIIRDGTPIENPMAMIQEFARQTTEAQTRIADPSQPSALQVTPIPHIIDGTPYDSPIAAIERLAQQTAIAQTRIADPSQSSILFITPIQPSYSMDQKLVFVVFPDGRKISYSPSEIGALPQTTAVVNGGEMSGVTLITFLQNAGWDELDVSAISLNGIGSLTIPKGQITNDDLLVLTGYSIKFISPSVSQSLWIDSLTVIEIY